jgi:hypothetical protein
MFYLLLVKLYDYLPDFTAILKVGTKTSRAKSAEATDIYLVCPASGV